MRQPIPGLTGFQTDRSLTTSKRPVAVPDANRIQGRNAAPQARVVDTYTRPAQAPVDNSAGQLADALASLNPVLARFQQATQKDPEDTYAQARRDIAMAEDKDEFLSRAQRGEVESLNNLEGQRALGEALGYEALRKIDETYNNDFDKATGDPDALFRETIQPYLDQFGEDRAFTEAFMGAVVPGREKLLTIDQQQKTDAKTTQNRNTVFSGWSGRIDYQLGDGAAPADIASGVFADFDKNRSFLNLPPKEQQQMVLDLAGHHLAKGNFDMAEALLTTERKAGPYKGSLVTDADFGPRATNMIAQIEGERLRTQNVQIARTAEQQARDDALTAAANGEALMLPNIILPTETGGTKEVTSDARLKQTALDLRDRVAGNARQTGMSPEQARNAEAQAFYGAGIEHPDWFRNMNGAVMQASLNNVTGENLPPELGAGFAQYKQMNAENPLYLGKFIDSKARDFYAAAALAQEVGIAGDDASALRLAHQATRSMAEGDPSKSIPYKEMDAAVKKAAKLPGWFKGTAQNGAEVRTEIQRTATLFTRMGLGPEQALEQAGEHFKRSHQAILGSFVKLDKRLPANFEEMATGYVADFIDQYGEDLGIDIDDVTVRDASNGVGGYTIVMRSTGMPVHVPGFKGDFGLREMQAVVDKARTSAIGEVVKEGNMTR